MTSLPVRSWLTVLTLATLVAAGCGALVDVDSTPEANSDNDLGRAERGANDSNSSGTVTTTSVPFGSIDDLDEIAGQIVVSTANGSLEIVALDGERRTLISRCVTAAVPISFGAVQGCPTQLLTQPTWSPDSSSVAATVVSADDQNAIVVVNAANPDDQVITNTSQPPYFYNWSDDGLTLLTLGPGRNGSVTLNRANARGTVLQTITQAVPIFVDWEPNGSDMVIHEGDRLNTYVRGDDGGNVVSGPGIATDNSFMTPIFLPDSRAALAVFDNELTRVDVDSGATETVVDLQPDGPEASWQYQMTATADATMLAVLGYSPTGEATVEVINLANGERQLISDRPTLWMEWNHQGTHLLLLTTVDGFAQWQLWSRAEGLLDQVTPVEPSTTELSSYIPFFDQYVASVHRWSPDGKAFVFAGVVDGRDGVWVQPVEPWGRPVAMGDGLVAWWSPT